MLPPMVVSHHNHIPAPSQVYSRIKVIKCSLCNWRAGCCWIPLNYRYKINEHINDKLYLLFIIQMYAFIIDCYEQFASLFIQHFIAYTLLTCIVVHTCEIYLYIR